MTEHRIFTMPFSSVYPLYLKKAERKNRTKEEVDQIVYWLTGYKQAELEEQIKLEAPKVLFADCVSQADNEILIGELAKLLKQNGMQTGQNRLFDQMREEGFIMKNSTMPTQRAMEMGLFRVIERSIVQPNGTTSKMATSLWASSN